MAAPTKQQIAKWKVNRKAWVNALRSGKYEQGIGRLLRDNGSYCCLGVLCDVIGMKPKRRDGDHYFDNEDQFAPCTAMRAVGLKTASGGYGDEGGVELTELNDQGSSFSDIADIIESEPESLFRDWEPLTQ